MPLAVGGLALNLVCIWLLHPPRHGHAHGPDVNLSAVYLHLTADAATSVLAIAGLLAGERLGWAWADPAAGLHHAVDHVHAGEPGPDHCDIDVFCVPHRR